MKLVKATVRTANGLLVECELTLKTIKELKKNNFVECELTPKTIKELKTNNFVFAKKLMKVENNV